MIVNAILMTQTDAGKRPAVGPVVATKSLSPCTVPMRFKVANFAKAAGIQR